MLASPAAGHDVTCNDRDSAIKHLKLKYGELLVAQALTSRGPLLELLRTEDGSTWTLIVSTPDGMSCIVIHGEDWRLVEPNPEGQAL